MKKLKLFSPLSFLLVAGVSLAKPTEPFKDCSVAGVANLNEWIHYLADAKDSGELSDSEIYNYLLPMAKTMAKTTACAQVTRMCKVYFSGEGAENIGAYTKINGPISAYIKVAYQHQKKIVVNEPTYKLESDGLSRALVLVSGTKEAWVADGHSVTFVDRDTMETRLSCLAQKAAAYASEPPTDWVKLSFLK